MEIIILFVSLIATILPIGFYLYWYKDMFFNETKSPFRRIYYIENEQTKEMEEVHEHLERIHKIEIAFSGYSMFSTILHGVGMIVHGIGFVILNAAIATIFPSTLDTINVIVHIYYYVIFVVFACPFILIPILVCKTKDHNDLRRTKYIRRKKGACISKLHCKAKGELS